jgi:hypothetical protein
VSRTALCAYAVAAALLLGATFYVLDRSHALVGESCRQLCDPIGMDYKVRAVPLDRLDPKYPGECLCVPRVPKRWWELWK